MSVFLQIPIFREKKPHVLESGKSWEFYGKQFGVLSREPDKIKTPTVPNFKGNFIMNDSFVLYEDLRATVLAIHVLFHYLF